VAICYVVQGWFPAAAETRESRLTPESPPGMSSHRLWELSRFAHLPSSLLLLLLLEMS
jgi:hypothetical protein